MRKKFRFINLFVGEEWRVDGCEREFLIRLNVG